MGICIMKRKQQDPMAAIYARRRAHLCLLVEQHGGVKLLGEKLGYNSGSFIHQVLADPPGRHISEVVARRWEIILGLKTGWLDS